MTPESAEIAAAVDRFPQHIRARLRDSLMRIVEVYRASGVQEEQEPRPMLRLVRNAKEPKENR